ncbi:hypothetical protein K2Y11_01210 [bacterium]|nr:hypothetical protein [bacterium]
MTDPNELRNALRVQTSRIIASSSRSRAKGPWGMVAVAYAAGVLTIVAINHFESPIRPTVDAPTVAEKNDAKRTSKPIIATEPKKESVLIPIALQLELTALKASAENGRELFRQAGDEYLASGDEKNAARCYANYLAKSPPTKSLTREPDDSWLLAVLKLDRKESERPHSEEIWK